MFVDMNFDPIGPFGFLSGSILVGAVIVGAVVWGLDSSGRTRRPAVVAKGRGGRPRPDSRWLLAPMGLFAASLMLPADDLRPRFGDGFAIFCIAIITPWWWAANPLLWVGCILFQKGRVVAAGWLGAAATALAVSVACFGFMPAMAPCYLAWVLAMASLCLVSLGHALPTEPEPPGKAAMARRDDLDEPL